MAVVEPVGRGAATAVIPAQAAAAAGITVRAEVTAVIPVPPEERVHR
jgi:hypothetical protein